MTKKRLTAIETRLKYKLKKIDGKIRVGKQPPKWLITLPTGGYTVLDLVKITGGRKSCLRRIMDNYAEFQLIPRERYRPFKLYQWKEVPCSIQSIYLKYVEANEIKKKLKEEQLNIKR